MENTSNIENEIRQIIEKHHFTAGKILTSKTNKHLFEYIMEHTSFLPEKTNITSRAFFVINHVYDRIKCIQCGKYLKNQNLKYKCKENFRDHFRKFCSAKCEMQNDETLKRQKDTNLEKYGCEWTFQSYNNKEKTKKTMINRYGNAFAQQNRNIKQKQLNTMIERYGNKSYIGTIDGKLKLKNSIRRNMYRKFSQNEFVKPMFDESEYVKYGDNRQYVWKCIKCGNIFKSFRNETWFKQGQCKSYARCENCFPIHMQTSNAENELKQFLESILDNSYSIKTNVRNAIIPYELDICLIKNEKIVLAIEFDGVYWHSDAVGTPKDYHLLKTELCEQKNIQLIHIFENEWLNNRKIVESRLKSILNKNEHIVFARQCYVKAISPKNSIKFQKENHIQGAIGAKVHLGLFFNENLVSVMTFGKSRFNKKYDWELLRFCAKTDYKIQGGASKLLRYFEKNYRPKSLISYADRRWSQGKLYNILGFHLDHVSKPDYWYVKNACVFSRLQFQKHKLSKKLNVFDANKSEIENMHCNKFNVLYDCGNLVFVKQYL